MNFATAEPSVAACAPVVVRRDGAYEKAVSYVSAHAAASAYHHPLWLEVIRRSFGHETSYLTAERAGRVVGVVPLVFFRSRIFGRFAVSMPFLNYGGILADDAGVRKSLLDGAIAETESKGGAHLELRHTERVFSELPARCHKVAMELRLARDVDTQWQTLDKKIRNQVRKAEKSDLDVQIGGDELVAPFYAVFARNMRDLGTPVYPVRFFREVMAALPDRARVLVVSAHGRPVAASLVHWNGHRVEVPWASALREFNPLCANVFLYWHMVRFAVERGLRVFDFGRSTPGEGTYLFKKQWGAEPRQLVWEYWTAPGREIPDFNPKSARFSRAVQAWQRLPVPVATLVGPFIVRNIP
jgi:FemAB-related protein (PEP-CTERM system-associated)